MNVQGVYTALITPFFEGEVDFESLGKLVDHQLKSGINGLVVNGTTAESPTLEPLEVEKIFKFVQERTAGQVPIFVGTGSNSTLKTIQLTQRAEKWGANGALIVCPYYNKPMPWGVSAHFSKVASETKLPIILYNIPGRSVINMTLETLTTLSKIKNIVGIKEATGDISFFKKLKGVVTEEFSFLSGDDLTSLEFCYEGGQGMISVMSHILPKKSLQWIEQTTKGQNPKETDFASYLELVKNIYCEANPIGVKWALYRLGVIRSPELRLPMTTLTEPNQKILDQTLEMVKPNF